MDRVAAIQWFRRAAEQGFPNSQYNLGLFYAKGMVLPQDEAEAIKWLSKAAAQGYLDAQYQLGLMSLYLSTDEDRRKEGLRLLRSAAERGHLPSQIRLGHFYSQAVVDGYFFGVGNAAADYKEALEWYSKAAEQGSDPDGAGAAGRSE